MNSAMMTVVAWLIGSAVNGSAAGQKDTTMVTQTSPAATAVKDGIVLLYESTSGRPMGEGINEWQSKLRLDRNSEIGWFEVIRSSSDGAGEPIGTFEAPLDDAVFQQVQKLVDSSRLDRLPKPSGGGPGVSLFTLDYTRGDHKIHKSFPSRDFEALKQTEELLAELNKIGALLREHPRSALRVTVAHVPGQADGYFAVTLVNIGVQRLAIADPRVFGKDEKDRWVGVQIAELPVEKPGTTSPPLQWSRHGAAPSKATVAPPGPIVLEPGGKTAINTVPWKAPKRGVRYIVQGIWCDYMGPSTLDGAYHVRGAAFSESVEIDIR